MKIAFRVDASEAIGTGHVMRCLSLADELTRFGASCRFIARALTPQLKLALQEAGYRVDILPASRYQSSDRSGLAHASWLQASLSQDAADTAEALAGEVMDWMVIDHYGIDSRWGERLGGHARRFAAIDDLADRQLGVNVLVDQNFHPGHENRYAGLVSGDSMQLLGPRFALLRPEFRNSASKSDRVHDGSRKVFVCLGGAAPKSAVSKVVAALSAANIEGLVTLVAPGFMPADLPSTQALEIKLLGHTKNMSTLLQEHDVAIGAGGGMLWERLCLGIPSIVIGYAANQRQGIASLLKAGLVKGSDDLASISVEALGTIIRDALVDVDWQAHARTQGKMLVDGFGAPRVAAALLGAELQLRRAKHDDALAIWPWRNDARTRRYSSNPAPLQLQEHIDWWARSVDNDKRHLFIGEIGSIPVGVIRFDLDANQATVSIYTDPHLSGSRIGTWLLRQGLIALAASSPATRSVLAEINKANHASLALFRSAGFEPQGENIFRLDLA